jgi:hypothetical protein
MNAVNVMIILGFEDLQYNFFRFSGLLSKVVERLWLVSYAKIPNQLLK